MRALVIVFSLFSVAAVEATPLPSPTQPQAQAQAPKQQAIRYRGLEKMLRRFSREAGEPRTRG